MYRAPTLFDLATAYHTCRDVETLLKTFAARLGSSLEARGALVWLVTEEQQRLQCRAAWGEPGERFDPASDAADQGILAEARESGRAIRLMSNDTLIPSCWCTSRKGTGSASTRPCMRPSPAATGRSESSSC